MIKSRVGQTHDNEDSGQEQETCALCPCPFKVLPLGKEWVKERQVTFQGVKEWEAVYRRSFKAQVISTTEKVGTSWPYGIYFGCVFLSYHITIHPAQRPLRLLRNCDLGSHFQVGQVITVCMD